MANNGNELTNEESLAIIQQMINTAKHEQKDDGKGWIIWGWMLFAASLLTVVNLRFEWFSSFFFWNVFGLATLIILFVQIITWLVKGKIKKKVKTYTQEIFDRLNTGFFISVMFIIVAMNVGAVSPSTGFPLLMSLYGFWILIYAAVLNFKPSLVGAYIMWILAFTALLLPANETKSFEMVMLLHAAGVLGGYIIPGHIANSKFKQVTAGKSSNQSSGV